MKIIDRNTRSLIAKLTLACALLMAGPLFSPASSEALAQASEAAHQPWAKIQHFDFSADMLGSLIQRTYTIYRVSANKILVIVLSSHYINTYSEDSYLLHVVIQMC